MKRSDHSNSSPFTPLGMLLAVMGGGEDRGNVFPISDARDFEKGARFIPDQVTDARRNGQNVAFIQNCGPCCWYWEMPDGSKIYHFDPDEYKKIAHSNNKGPNEKAGPCPKCKNENTNGTV